MDIENAWEGWSPEETALFNDALESIHNGPLAEQIASDDWVGFLYHEAMWDFEIPADYRQGAYDAFVDYMEENYGIEWDEIYDWEAYREAYDAA